MRISRKSKVFQPRTLLTWAVILLMVPFGYTLRNPEKEVRPFLGF